jgi:trimethylamine--corrinoid protein Co-methyltransferase
MDLKGLAGGQYKPLSDQDIATIHDTALTILEEVGFTYESGLDNVLDLLESAGAAVDKKASRVRFPRALIEERIRSAPGRVVLYSRDGKTDLDLGEDRVHLGTGGAAVRIVDLETGQYRSTTLNDLYRLGRLVQKLENIHFFLRPCIPTDIPETAYDVNVFYTCFKATTKHVMAGVNDVEGFGKALELASIVAGGRESLAQKPFISVITSFAISPLKLCTQSTTIMREAVLNNIPVALSCAPMAGSTSPVTMAATLAQVHAEQLAGIALCQIINPGVPVIYGGIPGTANMRNMAYQGGAVECGMMNAAIHQMAHHINVPNYNSSGLTDSKLPDGQAAWEKAITTLLAAMGGSNYIHHAAGMLDSMAALAYEQFVIDDEIIGRSCKVLKGIDVDAEHLALDVIRDVGPGGNFMIHPHTLKHMRSEYFPGNGVTDRDGLSRWEQQGRMDARERARKIVASLLEAPETPCISEEIDLAIRNQFPEIIGT